MEGGLFIEEATGGGMVARYHTIKRHNKKGKYNSAKTTSDPQKGSQKTPSSSGSVQKQQTPPNYKKGP